MDELTEEQKRNSDPRLANLKPFKPGQSGNPGGRPKGRSITAVLRELLESTEIAGKRLPPGKAGVDMLAQVIFTQALKGKFPFAKEVIERTEGKVPDRFAGADGESLPPTVIILPNNDRNALPKATETESD